MVFDETYLVEQIVDRLTGEMTVFQESNYNTEFNFDDCDVRVLGTVQEEYDYDRGDFFSIPSYTLRYRTSDLDITIYYEDCVYQMTEEEEEAIEKMIDV